MILLSQFAMLVATVTHFVGSKGSLNVWNPRVASPDDYTTSQIWLLSGGRNDYESLESGWMVNPKLYGDTQTRFFIHWTSDGSQKTGCFDLLCSGFVQTSQEVALGAAIRPVSSEAGPQMPSLAIGGCESITKLTLVLASIFA
ncbi:Aconitate hydratase A [Bienertia sinuspersici]